MKILAYIFLGYEYAIYYWSVLPRIAAENPPSNFTMSRIANWRATMIFRMRDLIRCWRQLTTPKIRETASHLRNLRRNPQLIESAREQTLSMEAGLAS